MYSTNSAVCFSSTESCLSAQCFGTLSRSCDIFMRLQCRIFHLGGMRCKKYTVLSYLFNQFNPKSEQNYYKSLFTFFLLSDARRGNLSTVIPLVSLRWGSVVNMLKHFSKYVKAVQKLRLKKPYFQFPRFL